LRSRLLPCVSCFPHTATTEIYTLSLHDALPISRARPRTRSASAEPDGPSSARSSGRGRAIGSRARGARIRCRPAGPRSGGIAPRSEEHTSELQSRENLVCRLLLEKKKKTRKKRA